MGQGAPQQAPAAMPANVRVGTSFGRVCPEISGQGHCTINRWLADQCLLTSQGSQDAKRARRLVLSAMHWHAKQAAHRENTNLLSAVQGNPLEVSN